MGACSINDQINLEDFQKLGVTLADVHAHYLETGDIGSPEFIRYKLDKLDAGYIPESIIEKTIEPEYSYTEKTVNRWLKKLSKSLGVSYEIVTEQEARDIHNAKGKTYNNEPAFFNKGIAYFISGRLTPQSVIHEFSHPFVKMLMTENPELFNTLYDRLTATEDGKVILDEVAKKYNNNTPDSLKEEVFVRALTASTMMTSPKEEFSSWIKEFLFNIKQALRRLIGKSIEIQNLSPMTTMRELADILSKGDKVAMDAAIYTDEEIFDYMRDYVSFEEGFTKALQSNQATDIQELINNAVNAATMQLTSLEENKGNVPGLNNLADLLVDEYDQGLLAKIKKELGPYSSSSDILVAISKKQTTIDAAGNEVTTLLNHADVIKKRLQALTNNLYNVNSMLDIMNDEIEKVSGLTSREQIDTLHYYTTFIDNWSTVVNSLVTIQTNYVNTNVDNDLTALVTKLDRNMDKAKSNLLKFKTDAVLDVLWEMTEPIANKVRDKFNKEASKKSGKIIDVTKIFKGEVTADQDAHWLEFHNMTKAQYEQFMIMKNAGVKEDPEFLRLKSLWMKGLEMTKDKLRDILASESGTDSNYFNGLLESASFNTDVTIFGLQQHIQSEISKYEIYAKTKFENYLDAVQPYFDQVNFQNRGSVGRELGQLNKVSVIVNDELVEHEEHGFLQEFIGWESDKVALQFAKKQAQKEFARTNSDVAEKKLMDSIQEYSDWKNKYMHQRYSSEYYEVDKMLTNDDIGRDAKQRRESIFEKMALVEQDANLTNEQLSLHLNDLWNEYKLLQSFHNLDGTMKTGADLDVSKRLKEYSEAKNKFITFYEIPGSFQEAYDAYSEQVTNSNTPYSLDVDSDYQKLMNKWLEQNTVVSLKNSIIDKKQKLLTERALLLEKLTAANKANAADDSEERQLVADMVKLITDNSNQPDGIAATPEVRKKVRDAHQEINEKSKLLLKYRNNGLSVEDMARLNYLSDLEAKGIISSAELIEKKNLSDKQLNSLNALGLDVTILSRLNAIDSDLAKMSTKEPTSSFTNVVRDMLNNDPDLLEIIAEHTEGAKITTPPTMSLDIEGSDIVDFVAKGGTLFDDAMKTSPVFKAFVEENFYKKSVYSADDSKYNDVLTLTDLWFYNKSTDVFDYKTKMLKDANGKNLGLIMIDGAYRSPSMAYQQRAVKDEYVTEKIVGQTVDNRGRWLPKAEPSNRYKNNKYEALKIDDPKKFEFLEVLKAQYLKMQEGAEDYDKLYLSYPQTRKTTLENVITGNVMKQKRRWNEFWYGSGDDLESIGAEKQLTADELVEDHKMGFFEHQTASMPVKGVARLRSVQDQSTDILKTMPEYMASLMHKEGAKKAASFSRNLLDVVNMENASTRSKANALAARQRAVNTTGESLKKIAKNRQGSMAALIERDLDGIFVTGRIGDPVLQKSLSAMAKLTGFRSFAANPISGLKNFAGIKLTSITHAAGASEFNLIDGALGEAWALAATGKISKDIRSRGEKSMQEQIIQLFDPAGGRSGETMGDNLSRTFIGDVLDLKPLQNMRKWMELEGSVQNFAALMYNKKVKITHASGSTKTIAYMKVFEMVDGRLQTKKGVDPEFALTYDTDGKPVLGEGLLKQKLKMQNVIVTMNGAFAKKDKAALDRYVLGKQMTFLRSHFIPMSANNFAFKLGTGGYAMKRMNWTTEKAKHSNYISTLKTLKNTLKSLGTNIPFMTKEELSSLGYVIAQIGIGKIALPYILGLFAIMKPGADDDDDESWDYKGMRERSGSLEDPTGTLTGKTYYDWDTQGFFANQAALLAQQTKDEYNSMNLTTLTGYKEILRSASPQPIMLAMQVKAMINLIDILDKSESDQTFDKKNVGPYWYHEKGYANGKVYDALFDMVGLNGANLDPVNKLKSYNEFKEMQ